MHAEKGLSKTGHRRRRTSGTPHFLFSLVLPNHATGDVWESKQRLFDLSEAGRAPFACIFTLKDWINVVVFTPILTILCMAQRTGVVLEKHLETNKNVLQGVLCTGAETYAASSAVESLQLQRNAILCIQCLSYSRYRLHIPFFQQRQLYIDNN